MAKKRRPESPQSEPKPESPENRLEHATNLVQRPESPQSEPKSESPENGLEHRTDWVQKVTNWFNWFKGVTKLVTKLGELWEALTTTTLGKHILSILTVITAITAGSLLICFKPVPPPPPITSVLFDESHGQNKWSLAPAPIISQGFKRIAEITKQRHTPGVLRSGELITLDKLKEYAAFVLPIAPEGRCKLKDSELEALKAYVRQGGGVLVLSTYTGDWHHEANLNEFTKDFGVTFNNDVLMPSNASPEDAGNQTYQGSPSARSVVSAQPVPFRVEDTQDRVRLELLVGVRRVLTLSSCSMSVTDAGTRVLHADLESTVFEPEPRGQGIRISRYNKVTREGPLALAAASKAGRVVAVGNWKMFLDEFVDASGYDNHRFYENILSWITSRQ